MSARLLELDGLFTQLGTTPVHHDVSLGVADGEAVTILGSNGAGKTTLLRTVMGLVRARRGRVLIGGHDLTGSPPHVRIGAGVAYVPEGRRVFSSLTVRENLLVGAYGLRLSAKQEQQRLTEVHAIFPVLEEKAQQEGQHLSGGQQQMLAIGRALMARPRLLLLDEPSLGLAPKLVAAVRDALTEIRSSYSMAVLIVEQNAGLAFSVCDRGYLMGRGRLVFEGTTAELQRGDLVRDLYLGAGAPAQSGR